MNSRSARLVNIDRAPPTAAAFSVRRFQNQFKRRDGGVARLDALVFARSPTAWRLAE